MTLLHDLVAEKGFLVLDGATGTELFRRGLQSGDPPEAWNTDRPEVILDAYRSYAEAGSDLILTNTFGGTRYRLALHKLEERVIELNKEAARLARTVATEVEAATGHKILVAGSMGPTGELMEPLGSMSAQACTAAFAEQAEGLAAGGADLLWIETISSLEEGEAAVAGARQASDLPICLTMSFDTAGRTMMGVTGTAAAELATRLGIDAVGANCGNNLADTEAAIAQMRAVNPDILIISKGNAGIPEWRGTELHYDGTPEVMAAYAARARDVGAQLIGACCGSTPEHIAMMRAVLDGDEPVPEVEIVAATTTLVAKPRGGRSSRRGRRSRD
ncbi:MAG: betaine--homocysteine S-methyltransferase [Acidimicrobiia bacterium]|nr:betaine--homocysteine S-methyltransferase [Acidimicrobiia bacterium]